MISFWPDHLELHGTLDRYRAAKEQIVRQQTPSDRVVVNADDASAGFADATPAGVWEFSLVRSVERGAFVDEKRGVVVIDGEAETALGHIEAPGPSGQHRRRGSDRDGGGRRPKDDRVRCRHRRRAALARPAGSTLGGVPVVDDGMAATPAKGAATLVRYPAGSIVLIAGGRDDAGGGSVHATPAEIALLEQACDVIARVARVVVLFGEAGPRLAALLAPRGVELIEPAISTRPSPPLLSGPQARQQWCSRRCSRSRSQTGSALAGSFGDPADAGYVSSIVAVSVAPVVEVRLHVLLQQPEPEHGKEQALEHLRSLLDSLKPISRPTLAHDFWIDRRARLAQAACARVRRVKVTVHP